MNQIEKKKAVLDVAWPLGKLKPPSGTKDASGLSIRRPFFKSAVRRYDKKMAAAKKTAALYLFLLNK